MPVNQKIWAVSEVNDMVREFLDQTFYPLWIQGEIGNLTIHRSGHVYMTLKDRSSQLRAVYFSGAQACRSMDLRQGSKVEVFGKLSLYAAAGEFQLNVRSVRLCGVGDLQRRFEELKRRLADEGLFDPDRKRQLPGFIRNIGLVTSASGAAVHDFIRVAHRRFPGVNLWICPVPVQGMGAEKHIAGAIRFFNMQDFPCGLDAIVVTRGGGSLEDLWPFNEEILARAVAASRIPVVSAVGHEIDFTICDFAADLRCPTPSAAAEMLLPEERVVRKELQQYGIRIDSAVDRALARLKRRVERASDIANGYALERYLASYRQRVDRISLRADNAVHEHIRAAKHRLERAENALEICSPYNTVKRGYVILTGQDDGHAVTTVSEARRKKHLTAVMADGTVKLDVVE